MTDNKSLRFLRDYPIGLKCALCGKGAGNHNAYTGGCPFGLRDRIGSYSHSTTQFFTPKMPKLPKDIKLAIKQLENAVIKATRESDKLQRSKSKLINRDAENRRILQDLDHAQYKFQRALAEALGTEKRSTTIKL